MFKAALFDMDGVIVNTEPLHKKAYFKMFKEVNIKVTDTMFEGFTGQSTLNVCKTLCKTFLLKEAPETLVTIKRKHFKHLFNTDPSLNLIEGVLELIKEYYANKITLVLASSASMHTINNVFKRFDLDPYFTAKISGADLPKSKPHPEIFIKAALASGHKKEECFVIEDATNGIKAAKSAGIYCIAYNSFHSKNQDYSLANKVINNFSEISFHKLTNSNDTPKTSI